MKKIFIIITISMFNNIAIFAMLESYNTYQFVIGERAAGIGGAYTSLSNDHTAIWYNPAGLANINNYRINISATSYTYLNKNQNNFWQAKQQDGSYKGIPLKQQDFSIFPNSLIFSYNIGQNSNFNHTIAAGIIIPMQDDIKAGIEGEVIGTTQSVNIKSVYNIHSRFYLGMIGYGISIDKTINIGLAGGLGYYQGNGDATITAYIDTNPNDLIVSIYMESNIKIYTFMTNFGIQYQINENNKIGLSYLSPALRVGGCREEIQYEKNNIEPANRKIVKKDKYIDKVFPGILTIGYGYEKKKTFLSL